jgi:Fe-S-cluster containining protein
MAVAPRHDDRKLHLHVLGEEHELSAQARVGPTRVPEVLPLARSIADGVTKIALDHVRAHGENVSCRAGCTACCRQVVPLAPLEAARLAQVVEAMPKERRRAVKKRFEDAVKRMEAAGLLDPRAPRGRAALLSPAATPHERWEDVSLRYFALHMDCPFLEDGTCSVYPERPAACREYHVTTPAELCETLAPGMNVAPRPVRMGEVLKRFTNEALGRDDPNVPLPLALEWASVHGRALDQQGDGEALAMKLVEQIQRADDAEN